MQRLKIHRKMIVRLLLVCVCGLITNSVGAGIPTKGKEAKRHQAFMAQHQEYDDPKLKAYVTKVGNKILAQSAHADRDYAFIIRDNHIPNAFVSGYDVVYVERGLLAILNSEAELAGVMAHEIGHNIGRHVKEAISRQRRNVLLANVASILVGNSGVGSAILTQASVNNAKYSRKNELEADSYGSKFLYGANYEPSQLVNALSQLADFGTFFAQLSNEPPPHHGLGSTHPRTDKRLRQVIAAAGVLPPGEEFIGREEYREAISGLVYGPDYRKSAPKGYKRYSNKTLGITFVYPKTWSFNLKGSKIVLKDPAKTAQLKITIEKTVDNKQTSEEALKAKYTDGLVDLQKIHPESERDLGTIAARTAQRVALSKVARNTFHFLGIAKNNEITAEQDKVFVDTIRSFRRMNAKDQNAEHITEIYFERLKPGETFASLAAAAGIKADTAELELRVINGYYPKGEPEPGTWIKKLRKVKID